MEARVTAEMTDWAGHGHPGGPASGRGDGAAHAGRSCSGVRCGVVTAVPSTGVLRQARAEGVCVGGFLCILLQSLVDRGFPPSGRERAAPPLLLPLAASFVSGNGFWARRSGTWCGQSYGRGRCPWPPWSWIRLRLSSASAPGRRVSWCGRGRDLAELPPSEREEQGAGS